MKPFKSRLQRHIIRGNEKDQLQQIYYVACASFIVLSLLASTLSYQYGKGVQMTPLGTSYQNKSISEGRNNELPSQSPKITSASKVLILESAGYHDEVSASFIYTANQIGCNVFTMFKKNRFGAQALFKELSEGDRIRNLPLKTLTLKEPPEFDLIVSVTCEKDSLNVQNYFDHALRYGRAHLVCVIHHGDERWRKDGKAFQRLEGWSRSGRLSWITLGPHVSKTAWESLEDHAVNGMKNNIPISPAQLTLHGSPLHNWPPVFALKDSIYSNQLQGIDVAPQQATPFFVIQGKMEKQRRSYDDIFRHWGVLVSNIAKGYKPHLRILGKVLPGRDLDLPGEIESVVDRFKNLSFLEYYKKFDGALALIPAFSGDDYYVSKASSSVAASIITGVPLIAQAKLLKAYTYIGEEDVYMTKEDESEVDVVKRILGLSNEDYKAKRNALQSKQSKILDSNRLLLLQILDTSLLGTSL